MAYQLVVADKTYSSWSLRPWLMMRVAGIPFAEVNVRLGLPGQQGTFLDQSPAGKVPVLRDGDTVVWDSLAILEYLAERHPEAHVWPADPAARAEARSVSAEMHSGFPDLRRVLGMNLRRPPAPVEQDEGTRRDVARIRQLWQAARGRFGRGGPFLYGRFSAADAMYAPVVTRFETYAVPVDGPVRTYMNAVLALAPMQEWYDAARREPPSLRDQVQP
ncbi:MAG TPA: glutathione S-transferase family protein [Hyphomicrobiales bacterium]|nr:glutathione S-transferase family protein [Hyphomicrobiales bacterium]